MDDLEEEGNSSSASDDDEECAPHKLTRAQRKRLRHKKLKENASRRRKIIGPLLPSPCGGHIEDKTPEVLHNAAEEFVGASGKAGNIFKFRSISFPGGLATLQSVGLFG